MGRLLKGVTAKSPGNYTHYSILIGGARHKQGYHKATTMRVKAFDDYSRVVYG
jgi:hypothetical protein